MATIKGLFFDLDGTLVNTYEADYLAYRDAIQEVAGVAVTAEAFYKTNGQEMRKKLETLAPGLQETQILEIAASKKRHYPNYVHMTTANDSLIIFLRAMSGYHTMVLVTTAKRQNAEVVLKHHNLMDHFDFAICGDDIANPKPHPESYLAALKKANLQSNEVLAFEDSQTGIDAATAADITAVHIRSFA